jgi:hypothetical protein
MTITIPDWKRNQSPEIICPDTVLTLQSGLITE